MHLDNCTIATMQADVCSAHLQYWELEQLLERTNWLQAFEYVNVYSSCKNFLKLQDNIVSNFKNTYVQIHTFYKLSLGETH